MLTKEAPEVVSPCMVPGDVVVQVTDHHISHGERRSAYRCAIAYAMRDAGVVALVSHIGIDVSASHRQITIQISPELKQWIEEFDVGLPVPPIRIRIRQTATHRPYLAVAEIE